MTNDDQDPPVADDDFPEFASAPLQKPREVKQPKPEPVDSAQAEVDDVIARIKAKKRAEGKG